MTHIQIPNRSGLSAWPGYPAAVRAGGFVFTSGIRGGKGYAGVSFPSSFRNISQGFTLIDALEDEVLADAWCAHRMLDELLKIAGTRSDQLLRQHMWQRDKRFFPILERVRKVWQPEAAPSSGLGVSSLHGPVDSWFGLEGIATDIGSSECLGSRRMLKAADDAANPSTSIYSRMVASGPMVFLAGHIPIRTTEPGKPVVASFEDVPKEGRFLATGRSHPDSRDGPIAAQAWFVYNEIRRALESQGMAMSDIVHVRAFLADLRDLSTFHRVHRHFFPEVAPALSIVQFAEVGHKGCIVEIEPTALLPGDTTRADIGWTCPSPFSGPAAVRAGPLVLLAGMPGIGADGLIATAPESVDGEAVGLLKSLETAGSTPSLPTQIWWAWYRVHEALKGAGVGLDSIVKTVVYLRDEADLQVYESVRGLFMTDNLPAFDCVIVPNPGPTAESAIQLDATAVAI